ncbi:MAG TPA: hypothetical protein PKD54_02450 [Pirellulaceae bacterium]|nr:hypothetical protein [Pirellulaceae bacterium]
MSRRGPVRISIQNLQASYRPRDELDCVIRVEPATSATVSTIETRVQWKTIGKGDEDQGVCFLDRQGLSLQDGLTAKTLRLNCPLPPCPLSFRGSLFQIRWSVSVRVELREDASCEEEFPFEIKTGCQPG